MAAKNYYVYKLLNPLKNNQPFYIGKGKDKRAYRHFVAVNWKESNYNPHKKHTLLQLKNAGLEPGIEIIPCNSEEEAYLLEIELISKYKRKIDGGILTNLCKGGEGNTSGHKKVHQYNVFREKISEFSSIKEAAKLTQTSESAIIEVCKKRGTSKTAGGFVWCYATDIPDWEWIFVKIKPVYQWSPDGELINRFINMSDMHRKIQADPSTISSFIQKTKDNKPVSKLPYGFIFTDCPTFIHPIISPHSRAKRVKCVETGQIFESCTEAEKFFRGSSNHKNISAAARGKQPTSYGYRWLFID